MTLQEMIAAAQKRVNESEGEDKAKAEAELSALKSVESAGYTKTQKEMDDLAGSVRSEGKEAGKKEARSEFLKSIGVSDEENEDEVIKAVKEWRDGQKTASEKLEGDRDEWKERAETAEARVSELESGVKSRDRKDAITTALSEANYTGKTSHAIGAIDPSKVKESEADGVTSFDATDAVKALSDDGFPGFEEPLNDPPNLERRRRKNDDSGKSLARRRQDEKNKRLRDSG